MNDWLETYRGIVYRWEVDHNDHLTVAFYFARLGDATLALLDSLGLGAAYTRRRGSLCIIRIAALLLWDRRRSLRLLFLGTCATARKQRRR